MESTYSDYVKSWDKMYSTDNLRAATSHDEEVKATTLQNLARNLREEEYNQRQAGKPQDLQTIYAILHKVKQDYESDYQEAVELGAEHPRMIMEHDIVSAKLDAQIEQVGWQIADDVTKNEGSDKKVKKPLEEVYYEQGVDFRVYATDDSKVAFQTCTPSTVQTNGVIEKVGVFWNDTVTVTEPNGIDIIDTSATFKEAHIPEDARITSGASYDLDAQSRWEAAYGLRVEEVVGVMSLDDFKRLESEIFPAVDKLIAEYGKEYHGNRSVKEQTEAYQNAVSLADKAEAVCLLAQAWGQSGHSKENEIEDLFAKQLFAMNEIIEATKVKGQERETAEDKSNIMKEGITMANVWGQKAQETQEQAAPPQWGQKAPAQEQKEESMAYIDKSTREAMDKDPKVKDMAFKMLAEAKKIGADIKEQNLTTKGKDREGKERLNKFVVSVKPAEKYNKETGKTELLTHKADNSPVLAATINHSIGNTTLTITAKEDMSNGVQLSSITAQQFKNVKDEQGKYVQKTDDKGQPVVQNGKPVYAKQLERASGSDIQNGDFNKYAKAVAARIIEAGFVKEAQKEVSLSKIPEDQKTPAMKFAEYANNEFKANGGQVMGEDGNAKTDAWAKYNPATENFGETVQLKSHSASNIVIELSTDKDDKPVAKATNFDVKLDNGRFASMYVNIPADLVNDKLDTVPKEIKEVVADFKGFGRQREQDKPKPKQQGMEM